jgi:hypothetical protein
MWIKYCYDEEIFLADFETEGFLYLKHPEPEVMTSGWTASLLAHLIDSQVI